MANTDLLDFDCPCLVGNTTWLRNGPPQRRVTQIGQTFTIVPNGNVSASLTLARAPSGNALTVSGLSLNGAFAVPGRYALTFTNAGLSRSLDLLVIPSTLPTGFNPLMFQSYICDDSLWFTTADATFDGLTSNAAIAAFFGGRARQFGATV